MLAASLLLNALLGASLAKSDFRARLEARLARRAVVLEREPQERTLRMAPEQWREDPTVPDGSIIFLGDSHTEWLNVRAVAEHGVNWGIGGDTTASLLWRLPRYQALSRASIVVLEIGANDLRRRTDAAIWRNYERILQAIPPGPRILVVSLFPVDERLDPPNGETNDRVLSINAGLRRLVAADPRCRWVDLHAALVDASGRLAGWLQIGDGLHLNAAGYAVVIGQLRRSLAEDGGGLISVPKIHDQMFKTN